jgi:hypothetical protein
MENNKKKLVKIEMLRPGEHFEIPSLCETMRRMKVITVSDCSTLIEGQKRDSTAEEWKPFRYHISNSVQVEVCSSFVEQEETTKSDGRAGTEPKQKNRRGRPSKDLVSLKSLKGINKDFTKKDIAELNNLKNHDVAKMVKTSLKNKEIKEVNQIKSGRGKPAKVYRII